VKFNEQLRKVITKSLKHLKGIEFTGYGDLYLTEKGLIDDEELKILYNLITSIPIFKFDVKLEKLFTSVSFEIMEKNNFLVYETDDMLIVIFYDPFKAYNYNDYLYMTLKDVIPYLVSKSEFEKLIKFLKYKKEDSNYENISISPKLLKENESIKYDDIEVSINVQIVNKWLNKAIILGASDIHIEPGSSYGLIRIRLDGKLTQMEKIDNSIYDELVSRIKILAGVDITQKLIPQDGKFYYFIDDKKYDIRLSTISTILGEKIVLRVLENQKIKKNFKALNYTEEEEKEIKKILKSDNGVILVTGPTGSGKTTTLYTYLQELIDEANNIVTVEDPVEYTIEGINQIQVNQAIGLTFNNILRSILRQDPNIIMIGEIRDEETAQMAMRASISGHLVLSTMHTNYAVGSIVRLLDMGVQRYLVSSAIRAVVSQKLVRKLCPKCKKEVALSDEEKVELGVSTESKVYKKGGCEQCYYTGYSGRILLSEILIVDDNVKDFILRGVSEKEINDYLISKRMITLEQKLKKAILDGIASIEEIK